ncbi:mucin-17-like isoform X1 [Sycon ciliatum]|uniref:mucin-17-like isoform X1 n=1 Tax=Sycon ciliatum TaxID=27933 RepID=UPI0031F6FCD6
MSACYSLPDTIANLLTMTVCCEESYLCSASGQWTPCMKTGVEPKHAAVYYNLADKTFYLKDLAGTTGDGVFVNGIKVEDSAALSLNDRLRFGYSHTTYTIELAPSAFNTVQLQLENLRAPDLNQSHGHINASSPVPAASSPLSSAQSTHTSLTETVKRSLSSTPVPPYAASVLSQASSTPVQLTSAVQRYTAAEANSPQPMTDTSVLLTDRNELSSIPVTSSKESHQNGASANSCSALYGVPDWWGQGESNVAEIHSVQRKPVHVASGGDTSSSSQSRHRSVRGRSNTISADKAETSKHSSTLKLPARAGSCRRSATPDAPAKRASGNDLSSASMRRTSSLRLSKEDRPNPQNLKHKRAESTDVEASKTVKVPSTEKSAAKRQASPAPLRENATVALRRAASAKKAAARDAEVAAAAAAQERRTSGTRASRKSRATSVRATSDASSTASQSYSPKPARLPSPMEDTHKAGNGSKGVDSANKQKVPSRSASIKLPSSNSSLPASSSPSTRVKSQAEKRSPRHPLRAVPLQSSSSSSLSSSSPSPATKRHSAELAPAPAAAAVKPRARSPWRSIRDQARKNINTQASATADSADIIFMTSPAAAEHGPASTSHGEQIEDKGAAAAVTTQSESLQSDVPDNDTAMQGNGSDVWQTGSDQDSLASNAAVGSGSAGDLQLSVSELSLSAVSSNTSVESASLDPSPTSEAIEEPAASIQVAPAAAAAASQLPPPNRKLAFLTEVDDDVDGGVCTVCSGMPQSTCTCSGGAASRDQALLPVQQHARSSPHQPAGAVDGPAPCLAENELLGVDTVSDLASEDSSALVSLAPSRRQWNKMEKMDGLIVSSLLVLSDRLQDASVDMCAHAREVRDWQRQQDHGSDSRMTPINGDAQSDRIDQIFNGVSPFPDSTLYPPWGAEHQV